MSLATLAIAVTSYGLLLYKGDTWTVYKQNPAWRDTAQYLVTEDDTTPGIAIVYAVTPSDALSYYLRREGAEQTLAVQQYTPEDLDRTLSDGEVTTIYLVRNRYWTGAFDEVLLQWRQDPRLALAASHSFKGVDLYEFTRRPVAAAPGSGQDKSVR